MKKINTLDTVKTMSDKEIQNWLRRIQMETELTVLPIAMLGLDNNITKCIFRNMSVPARKSIQQLMEEQRRNKLAESLIKKSLNIIGQLL
ncbi:MAG: hypothetical protein JXR70_08140 [Spirochaetales bacterium]|nr:hypothetical protein [Spirochaetales bacterium]